MAKNEVSETKEKSKDKKTVGHAVYTMVGSMLQWLDANVLPILAILGLAGLSVRGAQTLLKDMSPNIQLALAIGGVAFLVVTSFRKK